MHGRIVKEVTMRGSAWIIAALVSACGGIETGEASAPGGAAVEAAARVADGSMIDPDGVACRHGACNRP